MLDNERWLQLLLRLGIDDLNSVIYQQLMACYNQPQRAYHNQTHIAHCLAEFDRIKDTAEYTNWIEIAIWFHDAIYDPHESDNELRSADMAANFLRRKNVGESQLELVRELILATRHDQSPSIHAAEIIIDVDLAILGQGEEIYRQYANNIRREYSWVEDSQYITGRSKVLEQFLAKPRIYSTLFMFEKYETAARKNMERELKYLNS